MLCGFVRAAGRAQFQNFKNKPLVFYLYPGERSGFFRLETLELLYFFHCETSRAHPRLRPRPAGMKGVILDDVNLQHGR